MRGPRFSNLKGISLQKACQLVVIMVGCSMLGALFGCYVAVGNFDPLLPGDQHEAIYYPTPEATSSYSQVTDFLAADTTNEKDYGEGYNCVDYSMDVMQAATWKGIECSVVGLIGSDGDSHAIVAFQTEDDGWVFVEPQNDEVIDVYEGMVYAGTKIIRVDILTWKWETFEDWSD